MKVAIHHRKGSFSEHWIEYCKENSIEYGLVNAYDSDIIQQLKEYDAFMWHFHHADYRDMQFAKSLLFSLEAMGMKVYPDINTCWHFDDKVAQKYLLEAIEAPIIPAYVFHEKEVALSWAQKTSFPKVFKLKGGAGASNVKLAKTKKMAISFINQCFGKGFRQYRFWERVKDVYGRYRSGHATFKDLITPFYNILLKKHSSQFDHYRGYERGYAYFQEFIPNNNYDTRIIVINGEKAFGEKRLVRKNDFRASGSGMFIYDDIDPQIVKTAFAVAKRLKLQSVAFDFVIDSNNNPLIVEISYGFGTKGAKNCPGYWTSDMKWHECKNFNFWGWIIEGLLK